MSSRYSRLLGPSLFSLMSLAVYGGMARQLQLSPASLSGLSLLRVVGWYLLAFLVYGATLVWVERHGGISLNWMWGMAILLRGIFLFTTPALSNDVNRYLWDGHVANHGVSPYAYPIEAPELDYLEIPQRQAADHAWMASPYLPAAQLLFGGLLSLFPLDVRTMQAGMILLDLLTAVLLVRLLRLAGLPGHRLIIYLWHPLVIVETAHSAHVDAWMVWLTLAAIYLTFNPSFRGSRLLAPVLLAMATLTKIIPALTLPFLFWRWSWPQRILYGLVGLALLLPAGWQAGWGLSGPLDGTGLFGALRIYGAQWNFNSGLFHWLERWLGAPGYGDPLPLAKTIVFALMMLVLSLIFVAGWRPRSMLASLRQLALPFMVYLLLIPTLHPWYALILLAFLPFLPPAPTESRRRWLHLLPWLYLSGALPLSYLTYLNPLQPGELEWVRQVEWLPVLFLLVIAVVAATGPALIDRPEAYPDETPSQESRTPFDR